MCLKTLLSLCLGFTGRLLFIVPQEEWMIVRWISYGSCLGLAFLQHLHDLSFPKLFREITLLVFRLCGFCNASYYMPYGTPCIEVFSYTPPYMPSDTPCVRVFADTLSYALYAWGFYYMLCCEPCNTPCIQAFYSEPYCTPSSTHYGMPCCIFWNKFLLVHTT